MRADPTQLRLASGTEEAYQELHDSHHPTRGATRNPKVLGRLEPTTEEPLCQERSAGRGLGQTLSIGSPIVGSWASPHRRYCGQHTFLHCPPRPERPVPFPLGAGHGRFSLRLAAKAGAPAKRIDARQGFTNEWRSDSSEVYYCSGESPCV